MHNKIIRDAIHGDINLGKTAELIIGHQFFQRLKRISQNGFLYLVYPGMKHSRFEHALGVYHLAQNWIDEIIEVKSVESRLRSKIDNKFPSGTLTNGTELLLDKSFSLFELLNKEWREIICIAALTHDLGHGPLSHTLEKCSLLSEKDANDFALVPEIREYFAQRSHVEHEDFTILYLNRILYDLSAKIGRSGSDLDQFINRISSLISKEYKQFYLKKKPADEESITLFSCFISSLFDVDRMDYLRRDSQKAGVEYGNVDIYRIMKTCVPVLYKDTDSKLKGGFITSARNVHVLDHFLISLFEMYTILYLHPRNISTDYEFSRIIKILKEEGKLEKINITSHARLDEWSFLNEIDQKSYGLLKKLLDRQTSKAQVVQVFTKENVQNSASYEFISQKSKRPFFKGNEKVFLTERSFENNLLRIVPWDEISLVAKNLNSESYSPQIWWSNREFIKDLEELKSKLSGSKKTQSSTGTNG